MDKEDAILALSALAQGTRLDAFTLLVQHEPLGLPAGDIARSLAVPHNTLSSHLGILSHAGLVQGRRHSRSIIYRADLNRLRDMTLYLIKDCCQGSPELCTRFVAERFSAVSESRPKRKGAKAQ